MTQKIDNLLLHPKTAAQIELVATRAPHAIMLAGARGSGKKTLAKALGHSLLQLGPENDLDSYPYYIHVARLKNKQDITIEQVRDIINTLKLKIPSQKPIKRVVFIEDAQYLSVPAQNALLKILEEPSASTIFLLSVESATNVLPTVASRAQLLDIHPVSLDDAQKYFRGTSAAAVERAWLLSEGTAGLLSSLLDEKQVHPLKEAVEDAKKFLRAKTYERLLLIDRLCRNKEQFVLFLDALARTLRALQHSALKSGKAKHSQLLLRERKNVHKAQSALLGNANPKLTALELALNLKI